MTERQLQLHRTISLKGILFQYGSWNGLKYYFGDGLLIHGYKPSMRFYKEQYQKLKS